MALTELARLLPPQGIGRGPALLLILGLFASPGSALSAIVIECPGSPPEEFDEPWEAPCVEMCQGGTWRIRTEAKPLPCLEEYLPNPSTIPIRQDPPPSAAAEGRGPEASTSERAPRLLEADTATQPSDAPIELTRQDLETVASFTSADIAVQGYKLGDVVTNWETVGSVRTLSTVRGLDIRVDRNDRIEQIIIEPEFADRLVGNLKGLLLDFSESRMRSIFGVEDAVVDLEAADTKRELKASLKRIGVDVHVGKKYRYARLGVEVVTRSGHQAALVLTIPAARR